MLQKRDADAVFAVVTADHVIEPVDVFQNSIRAAFDVVKQQPNALVTFGIVPTHGHTGLGYIHRGEAFPGIRGAYKVQAFKEKPDQATADRYVDTKRYYWNSGMFVWRCDTILNELQAHLPDSYRGLMKISEAWDSPRRDQVLKTFAQVRDRLEPADRVEEAKGQARYGLVRTLDNTEAVAETLAEFVKFNRSYNTVNNFYRTQASLTPKDLQDTANDSCRSRSNTSFAPRSWH